MNIKNLSALIVGLLASSVAMASAPDYGLLTSANLTDSGSYDSGLYTSIGVNHLGSTMAESQTTASILGTYQGLGGQWFQTTQFTTVTSYDQTLQDVSNTQRYLQFSFSASVSGDQWVDLSLSTSSPMNYYVYAYGTTGSKTSPRGFTQIVTPSLGQVVDGNASSGQYTSVYSGSNNWYSYSSGSVGANFQAIVEATDGGAISQLYVNLYTDQVLGAIRTEHVSYVSNQWIQDVAISAPPVPEPEAWAMMMAGLGLVGFVARRRRQTAN